MAKKKAVTTKRKRATGAKRKTKATTRKKRAARPADSLPAHRRLQRILDGAALKPPSVYHISYTEEEDYPECYSEDVSSLRTLRTK